jgi:DNA invertase Pin-like site-specific DNA recombinase
MPKRKKPQQDTFHGRSRSKASKAHKPAFDPAAATAEELACRPIEEMFDLAQNERAKLLEKEVVLQPVPVTKKLVEPQSRPKRSKKKKIKTPFDPALASVEELASRSMDEMFDLSKEAREILLAKDAQFEASLAAIGTTNPSSRTDELKASTVLRSRIPVIVYARFSDDQQNPLSIDDQFAEARRYCDAMGYEPIMFCSDAAMTGQSLTGRDGWDKVEQAVAAGMAAIVVAESLDRVARSAIDLLMIMEKLRHYGAFIDTPSTGRASELQGLIHSIYNFLFKSMLVEKVVRGMAGAVRRGRHPGGTNFGLRKVRDPEDPEKDEYLPYAPEVEIYFRVMWEIGVLKRSYEEICGDLNSEGIPAPRGGLWGRQNFDHPNGLGGLATNKRCIGIIVWNKASYRKDRSGKVTVKKNDPSEHKIGFNAKQAFIPAYLFRLVQEEAALRKAGPAGPRRAALRRLLTNRLKCGVCGRGMRVVAADTKRRSRVGCSTVKAKAACSNRRTFYLDTIERMVAHAMANFMSTPGLAETTFDATVKEMAAHRKELMRELQQKTAEKDGLTPMTEDLIRKMASADVDRDMLLSIIKTNLKPLYDQRQELDHRIKEIQLMLASEKLNPKKLKNATNAFASIERLLEQTGGSKLPKDLIVSAQALIGNVSIFPDADSRHFELRIAGRFDSMLTENYLASAAVISSQDYKNAKMGGPHHRDKLTLAKPFYITVSSAAAGIPVDIEVRERPVRPFSARRRTTAHRSVSSQAVSGAR